MKKRRNGFKGFRGVGKPKREWDFGPPIEFGVVRRLGRGDTFGRLTDKGKGQVLNLVFDRKLMKRVFIGRGDLGQKVPVVGTGRASRLSKPELLAVARDIRRRLDIKQYEVI